MGPAGGAILTIAAFKAHPSRRAQAARRRAGVIVIAAAAVVASCGKPAQQAAPPAAQTPQGWTYSTDIDSMRDISVVTGCGPSAGPANTTAGQTGAQLCFQLKGDATHAWVELTNNGALRCDVWPGTCTVMARLDEGQPFELTVTEQPGVPNRLYVVDMRTLLTRITGAGRLLVETPIDTQPAQDIGFPLLGLDFNRLQFPADAFKAAAATDDPAANVAPPPRAAAPKAKPASASASAKPKAAAPAAAPAPADDLGRDPPDHDQGAG